MRRFLATAGNGFQGRLGHSFPCTSETLLRVVPGLLGHNVDHVVCGGAHTAVVTDDGTLFTFGLNDKGQLGHSREDSFVAAPIEVGIPDPVKLVAAGDHHTLCLTRAGEVWSFGAGGAGQLGIPESVFDKADVPAAQRYRQVEPRLVHGLQGVKVVALAAGASHSMALSADGEVFSWGHGEQGSLGHGAAVARVIQWTPRVVRALSGVCVRQIAAGPASSGAVDDKGTAFTWGHGLYWQLGHTTDTHKMEPTQLGGSVPPLSTLTLGHAHGLALARDGHVLVWGMDDMGSLGCGDDVFMRLPIKTPEQHRLLPKCTSLAIGWKHSAAMARDGQLLTWGWAGAYTTGWMSDGGAGQLALGDETDRWGPSSVLRLRTSPTRFWDQRVVSTTGVALNPWRVLQVAMGRNHTAAVVEGAIGAHDIQ